MTSVTPLIFTYRVLSRPYVRLHASDDLALGEKISELFEVVQQCLDSGMPAVLSRSAAAVRSTYMEVVQRFACTEFT